MNTILLILCNALSCFIISTILFQFMNGKYKKSSQSRYVYRGCHSDFYNLYQYAQSFHIKFGGLGRVDGDNSICSVL